MAANATKIQVLSLYKKLLRTAQHWQASTGKPEDTRDEQIYIRNETKTLFKKNKEVCKALRDDTFHKVSRFKCISSLKLNMPLGKTCGHGHKLTLLTFDQFYTNLYHFSLKVTNV